MFEEFGGIAHISGLRFAALKDLTELDWFKVATLDEVPRDRGVYAWVDPASDVVHYHGSGDGVQGLHGRLRGQLRWRSQQRVRLSLAQESDDIDAWYRVVIESPAIRLAAESEVELWVAVAREAVWVLGTEEDEVRPSTARAWECFIYECSHLVTGRRSLLGGGAWEAKPGTLGYSMEKVAWSRLRQVSGR